MYIIFASGLSWMFWGGSLLKKALFGVVLWQLKEVFQQERAKATTARAARAYADAVGKPLLVIGGPLGQTWYRQRFRILTHECGDVCSDLNPAA